MNPSVEAVALDKAWRLLNHGPTVLVSACHEGVDNVMAAAWACALDFSPAKVTVVLDKSTRTRALIEQSGLFVLQIPTVAQAAMVHKVGHESLADHPNKLAEAGVELFRMPDYDQPMVDGCSGWLLCKVVDEPWNQAVYDLFIGEVVAAWADTRVFRDGHWHFEDADPALRSLHYVAGGRFYAIGEAIDVA
ncbi:flavin reductase family protein [Parathalassolituus penaei]|mgnify:CR=1 FL=1|uniref:Flavin reductase family protein n=1 Tax=Parathalassolituus penaei TaxID=2997323 RepID=A0A9X3IU28_9GAMM|nr:flavin reductase family protein [Parathalassolituus penaei]MCY0965753.1 flavin reductase family protein [Parathalassolituus penaei]